MPRISSKKKLADTLEDGKQKTQTLPEKVKGRGARKKKENNHAVKVKDDISESPDQFDKINENKVSISDDDIDNKPSTQLPDKNVKESFQKKATLKKISGSNKLKNKKNKVLTTDEVFKAEKDEFSESVALLDSEKNKRKRNNKKTFDIKVEIIEDENSSLKISKRLKNEKIQPEKGEITKENNNQKSKRAKRKKEEKTDSTVDKDIEDQTNKHTGRVKKIKEEKPDHELDKVESDFKIRESASMFGEKTGKKFVGAHVSINGGLANAVTNAVDIGAQSFALFLRSQRQWASKPLTEEAAALFREACQKFQFPPHLIIPHGSYLLNCGAPNEETLRKSREALVEELKRCEMLGLTMFNFHPGSTCGEITIDECLDRIAESINKAHEQTKYVITVIENMSCQGSTVGGDFKELRGIIDRVTDKSRIGVCLDTCHAYAAGYDLSKYEGFQKMMNDFETIIGIEYLKAVHMNDSQGKLGCHLDRHENIGRGHIGLEGFRNIMNDPRFDDIPLILETPANLDDAKEIVILHNLCK